MLKLNVGLNKKIGEANYGSRGASINVELELDGSVVTEPSKLQDRIRQLFNLVRSSLAEELNGNGNHVDQPGNNGQNNNQTGNGPSQASQKPGRPATQSQVKALHAITRNQRVNLEQLLRQRFQVNRPEDLTLKQASQMIDDLKNNQGGS